MRGSLLRPGPVSHRSSYSPGMRGDGANRFTSGRQCQFLELFPSRPKGAELIDRSSSH
jgi:hypothetical protein